MILKHKVIGIVGSRRRDSTEDYVKVLDIFKQLKVKYNKIIICSGRCPQGADSFAFLIAQKYKQNYLDFPAEWDTFGKSAGYYRNTFIAEASDVLVACVAADRTGGTEDTISKFLKFKKLTEKEAILTEELILV